MEFNEEGELVRPSASAPPTARAPGWLANCQATAGQLMMQALGGHLSHPASGTQLSPSHAELEGQLQASYAKPLLALLAACEPVLAGPPCPLQSAAHDLMEALLDHVKVTQCDRTSLSEAKSWRLMTHNVTHVQQ